MCMCVYVYVCVCMRECLHVTYVCANVYMLASVRMYVCVYVLW